MNLNCEGTPMVVRRFSMSISYMLLLAYLVFVDTPTGLISFFNFTVITHVISADVFSTIIK